MIFTFIVFVIIATLLFAAAAISAFVSELLLAQDFSNMAFFGAMILISILLTILFLDIEFGALASELFN